jgi:hypothetical protein
MVGARCPKKKTSKTANSTRKLARVRTRSFLLTDEAEDKAEAHDVEPEEEQEEDDDVEVDLDSCGCCLGKMSKIRCRNMDGVGGVT